MQRVNSVNSTCEIKLSPWVKVMMTLTTKENLTSDQMITMMLIAQMAILAIAMTVDSTEGEIDPTMRIETMVTTRVIPQLASREQMKS